MRQISAAYTDAAQSDSLEPVFVAKLINDNATVYLTTRDVTIVDGGSIQLQGVINSAPLNGQAIKPEDGISSIGGMTLSFDDSDRAFTAVMTTIDAAGSSIYNNRVELYTGFTSIDFTDYVLITPLYVRTFTPSELNYSLRLTDVQRITEKSLFADPLKTELVGNYGFKDTTTVEVLSPAGYPLVEHNADWAEDPNTTIGYLKVFGLSKDGREVKEVISYTNTNTTQFTGVVRSRFGTERVDLSSTDSDSNPVTIELIEMVYIDLVQPAMVLALLTGDLYGQVGQTLPDGWHAGLDASLINTVSFDDIGGDLWQEHIEFRDLDTEDAKEFIAGQCLSGYGTFLRVDQNGQYELSRYDYVSRQTASAKVLGYAELITLGSPSRDAASIKNFFQIDWGWRIDQDYYARHDFYIDGNSQTKYSVESDLEVIQLRGLRNRDVTSKPSLDFVAQSLVKRKSNPRITRSVTCLLNAVIDVEVGDLVTILADNEPDYRTGGAYQETFEVQSIGFDFLQGTASLKLFASEGTPSNFVVSNGSNVVSIDRTGWTNLDGSGYGVNNAGTFEFNNGANVLDGRYYFNGDIEHLASRTITINGSVYIDCANFNAAANSIIDGDGRGVVSDGGYFGSGFTSQSGIESNDPGGFKADRLWFRGNQSKLNTLRFWTDLPNVQRIEDGASIDAFIPAKLYGCAGPAGGSNDIDHGAAPVGSLAGGASVAGGAGLFISCDAIQLASTAQIKLSGLDGNMGGVVSVPHSVSPLENQWFHAGASGYGWPGVCIVALKDLSAAKPFLYEHVTASTGSIVERASQPSILPETKRIKNGSSDKTKRSSNVGNYRPKLSPNATSFQNTNYAAEDNRASIHVMNFVVADAQVNDNAVDEINSAPSPSISYVEYINVPETQLGDQVTYELTAANNSATKYVQFEYRLLPDGDFNQADYKLTNESIIQETGTGDTYEIRATAFNFAGKAGGVSTLEITFPLIVRDADTSAGGQDDASDRLKLPDITGLELINRIDNNDNWNQWKSPNAEFKWRKMSNTLAASVATLNGVVDLHLEGYSVRITDENGNTLREEIVKDSFYTYTYDENKKDNNGSPVRKFTFEVQAVSTTGYASEYVGFEVENPAPAAPANVTTVAGFTSILFQFGLPSDVDFVGVDFYLLEGASGDVYANGTVTRISGNTFNPEGLTAGTTYQVGAVSVDQFGTGGQLSQFGITTNLIPSTALGNITTPVVIDEVGGRLITNNAGYIAFHGATNVPSESANPLIFGAYSGVAYPFWVDAAGDFSLGNSDITYKNQSLEISLNADISGVDAYNNGGFVYYNIHAPLIDEYKTSSSNLTSSVSGGTVLFQTGAAGFFEYSANIINASFEKMGMDNEVRLKIVAQVSLGLGVDECDLFIGFRTGTGSVRDGFVGVRIKAKTSTNTEYDLYAVKGYDISDGDVGPSAELIGDEITAGSYYIYEIIYTPGSGVSITATAISSTTPIQSASAFIDSTGISQLSSVLDVYAFRGNRYSPSAPTFRTGDFRITGRGD